MKRKLLKAAGVVGAFTLLSRVLGMIRDIVSAKSFGTTWQWDAFIYAFMLPNFMRRLVGEGALSSAFIPIYAEVLEKEGKEAAFRFANIVFTILSLGLVTFLLLAEVFITLSLKSFELPQVIRLTFGLLHVLFPYLFFISLCALTAGILNSHRHFFSPSLGPAILDIVWILAVIWICPLGGPKAEDRVFLLAICLLVSGVIQLWIQLPFLNRLGFRPKLIFDFLHPGLRKIGNLVLPAVLGFAVTQINILVDATLAFWVGEGANSSLWYGNRLMQFPLGVFAIAMGTALLPTVSSHTARQELEEAKRALSFSLRVVFFIVLPSTAGLIALRTPIIQLLFERGEFDALSTARTSFVLLCYTIGLFAFSGQKLIVTGFYSMQDTKTPMKTGVLALVLNLILNLILMRPLREGGLALATSISGIFNFLFLVYLFQKKIGDFPIREIITSALRLLAASLIMGIFSWYLFGVIHNMTNGGDTFRLLIGVFGSVTLSVLLYLGLCFLFRVPEMHEAIRWFRQSRGVDERLEKVGEEPL
ncbi:MAG: murein biosynthesis integral membrane protein MurJ [Candidatus Omnitrophica bacterium]|nr:murein biosynthesis integral membrane protein MurJ [Candidatus Omnitrophota bacterium]